MSEERSEPEAETGRSGWVRALDWIPVAWLAVAGTAYLLLVTTPVDQDRAQLPVGQAAEWLALPLLCLLSIAAIIRYFSVRKGQPRLSPAAPGEGQDNV